MKTNNERPNLPNEVQKQCFLFEVLDYLLCSFPPMELLYEERNEIIDERIASDTYCDGVQSCNYDYQEVNELITEQYSLKNPYYEEKYQDVNFHQSIEQYDRIYTSRLDNYPEKSRLEIQAQRPLIMEYIKECEIYNDKLQNILEPLKLTLLSKLQSGEIRTNGIVHQKWNDATKEFEEIEDIDGRSWTENIQRVTIPKEHWKMENIDWKESDLKFSIANDTYKYGFILVNFEDVYKHFPKQIDISITAMLVGNKIIYDNKEYLLNTESSKGRKPLEWNAFYEELIRHIIQDCNGRPPVKQEALYLHMQEWAKNNLNAGSRGSIYPKITNIYNKLLQNQKSQK